jgi:hypothetical protein
VRGAEPLSGDATPRWPHKVTEIDQHGHERYSTLQQREVRGAVGRIGEGVPAPPAAIGGMSASGSRCAARGQPLLRKTPAPRWPSPGANQGAAAWIVADAEQHDSAKADRRQWNQRSTASSATLPAASWQSQACVAPTSGKDLADVMPRRLGPTRIA